MRLKNWSQLGPRATVFTITLLVGSLFGIQVQAQTKEPETVVIRGRVVDLTCAVKGKALMEAWNNVGQDHMMADGNIQKGCASMCLTGGHPAALFSDDAITAVFACNPRGSGASEYTLAKYASAPVEFQGYWASPGVFVPQKVRRTTLSVESRYGSGGWRTLDCAIYALAETRH